MYIFVHGFSGITSYKCWTELDRAGQHMDTQAALFTCCKSSQTNRLSDAGRETKRRKEEQKIKDHIRVFFLHLCL